MNQGALIAGLAARGCAAIPWRGPLAANTVAGAVSGWGEAFALSRAYGGRLPLSRILEDAIWHAENGFPVTASQHELTASKRAELIDAPGFCDYISCRRRGAGAGLPYEIARTRADVGAHRRGGN